jgi:flagellar FliL protein
MAEEAAEAAAPKKGGKKKLMMIVAGVVVLALAGGGFMMMKGGGKAEAAEAEDAKKEAKAEELGEIIKLDAITLNLADGDHYLKVGIALQLSKKAPAEEVDAQSPRALDETIRFLGAHSFEELNGPKEREKARKELAHKLGEMFEENVIDVYFTDFVMQ